MSFDSKVISPRNPFQVVKATPANPTGTTSLVGVHAGLAVLITPQRTGRILVIIQADGANNTAADGAAAQIRFGTGAAPANGAALTGTADGPLESMTSAAIGATEAIALVTELEGLIVGTQTWLDISEAAVTGGTASFTSIIVTVIEF